MWISLFVFSKQINKKFYDDFALEFLKFRKTCKLCNVYLLILKIPALDTFYVQQGFFCL